MKSILGLAIAFYAANGFAADTSIRANFTEFTGHYEVLACTGEIQKGLGTELRTDDCGKFKTADIFFGDDYQPKADGTSLFMNLTGNPADARDFAGIGLANDDAGPEDLYTTYPGHQTSIVKSAEVQNIVSSVIQVRDGLTSVTWTVIWPDKANYLYRTFTAVLKRR